MRLRKSILSKMMAWLMVFMMVFGVMPMEALASETSENPAITKMQTYIANKMADFDLSAENPAIVLESSASYIQIKTTMTEGCTGKAVYTSSEEKETEVALTGGWDSLEGIPYGTNDIKLIVTNEGTKESKTYTISLTNPEPVRSDDKTLWVDGETPITVEYGAWPDNKKVTVYQANEEGVKTENSTVTDSHKYYYAEIPSGEKQFKFTASPNNANAKIQYSINGEEWDTWGTWTAPAIDAPAVVKFRILDEKAYFTSPVGFEGKEVNEFTVWVEIAKTTPAEPAADAKVSVTISDKGVLASDKDGAVMANREVTVTDMNQDGILTYHEALVAVHKTYKAENDYGFTDSGYGYWVTKIWGTETSNVSFYHNNLMCNVTVDQEPVAEGDTLYFSLNQDNTYYSDKYTYFDVMTKEVIAGTAVELLLQNGSGTSPVAAANITIGTWEAGEFKAIDGKVTDGEGKVSFTFDKAGTYCITASGTIKDMVPSWSTEQVEFDCPITAPVCVVTVKDNPEEWTGSGTEEDPYILTLAEHFDLLDEKVTAGESYSGKFFKVGNDITLNEGWNGIGYVGGKYNNGATRCPFGGIFDGDNHTITFPAGSKALFDSVRGAAIKNIKIQGEYIDDNGLITYYLIDYGKDYDGSSSESIYNGVPTADIDNVTILAGTKIKGSGFLSGPAASKNTVNITNCTIEAGVVIGCDKDGNALAQDAVGGFSGNFNGTIKNSTCAATVYGKNYVGGIVAGKANSMGDFVIENCTFSGKVISTGNFAGGIAGAGYTAMNNFSLASAPNTACVTVKNCTVTGLVQGNDYVGGIFGGEEGSVQCWENGIGSIMNNIFTGTVKGSDTAKYVGAIIGYMHSLNKYNIISGNKYYLGCGSEKGIGGAYVVDTEYADPTPVDGVTYVNSKNASQINMQGQGFPEGFVYPAHQRTDDPLGADASKLCSVYGEWKSDSTGWWYSLGNGNYYKDCKAEINGKVYFFDPAGYMVTGWKLDGDIWYYMDEDGAMATGWLQLGGTWYYMKASGAMATGWLQLGGTWYYMNTSGAMVTNQWVGNYYLTASGAMATNTWIGSYYVGADGRWVA